MSAAGSVWSSGEQYTVPKLLERRLETDPDGEYLDINGTDDEVALHKLKTGCLFSASVAMALWAAGVPETEQDHWRAFGDELGMLFQVVDDILDQDGFVVSHGEDGARRLADEAAARAHERLAAIPADTSVLDGIVSSLAARTT